MKDHRNKYLYLLLTKIEAILRRIRFHLYEKNRFQLADIDLLVNNYSPGMINNLRSFVQSQMKYTLPYDRKLFIHVIKNILSANDLSKVLDVGGGDCQPIHYLQKISEGKIKVTVIEQKEIVKYAIENGFDKTLNLTLVDNSELIKGINYDLIMFNGSLSYMQDPVGLLNDMIKQSGCQYVAISRLPVTKNSLKVFTVKDSYGGHYEQILPFDFLQKVENFGNILFCEYDELHRSKSVINGKRISSLNIIFETSLNV